MVPAPSFDLCLCSFLTTITTPPFPPPPAAYPPSLPTPITFPQSLTCRCSSRCSLPARRRSLPPTHSHHILNSSFLPLAPQIIPPLLTSLLPLTALQMFQSLLCLLSVGPSLPPNHSMPTERLNRTFPSLLHPPSSSPSLLSSSSSSSSPSSAASPTASKPPSPAPLIFQYTFPLTNTSLDFLHSDFLTVLESAPSHAPGQSDTPSPDTPPASMAVPDTPNPLLTKNMPEGTNNSSITATNIVASFGSSSNAGIGRSLLTDTSETTQEPGSDGLNAVELGSDRSGAAKPSSEGLGAVRVVRLDAWAAYVVAAQPHVLVIHTGGAWVGLQQRWQEHRARIHASQEGQKGQEGQEEGQKGQKGQEGQEGQEGQSAANESKVFAAVAGKGVEGGMREEKVGAEGKVEVGGGKGKAGGGKGEPGGGKGEVGGGNWKAGGGKGEPGGGKGEVGGGKGKAGGGNGEPGGGKGEVGGGKGKAGGGKGEAGGGTGGNGGGNKGTGEKAKGKGGGKKGNGGEKRGNGGEKKGSGGEKKGSGGENRGNGGENRGNGGENRGNGGENKGNGGGNRGNGGENRGNGGENKGNGGEKKGNGGGKKGNGGGKKGNGGGKKGNSGGNGVDGWKNKGSGGGNQGNGGGNQGNGGGSKEAGQGNDGGNGGKGGGSKEVGQGNQGNGAGRKGNSVGDNKISAGNKGNGGMALGDNSKAGQKGGGTGKQAGSEMKKAGGKGESSGDKAKEKRKAVAETASGGGGGDTTSGSQTDPFAGGELRMGDFGNMSILDGMDGADEAGLLGSTDGSDAAEGGSGEAVGGSKLEEGDVRLEEGEQQTGGSFMADEADIVLEEMSEVSSSVGRGSFLDEDRAVENDEVPEQQQQGGSVMADEADQVQEEMSEGRLSEGEVMPSVKQVTFDEEGEAAKEDAVQEKDNESHIVTGAENDEEVRGEDVHNEAANKGDESPGGPSVLPPNLLDSVDFLDPVAAFTKTLRMLHHFLSSQPTAESLPTFFLGLPREHYFRADEDNSSSLCLPDDATCRKYGQCSGNLRPREWLEEGGEEQAHQQRWQRWRWRQERERREREKGPNRCRYATTSWQDAVGGPKRRRYATTSWQDAVGGGSSGGGGAGAGAEGAGAAAGGGGGSGGEGGAGGTGGGARKGVYHCNYCHRDVTGEVRVKCAACVDFDLCAECFSVGAAAHPHSASHPYHVMDTMSFPLVHEDWTADEEMLLLEALEMYGMGNWGEIAEHVGSKSKTQCHDHYLYDYLLSPTGPLPDLSRLRTQADTEAAKAAMEEQEAVETAARAQEAVLFNVPVVKPESGSKADEAAAPITSGYNTKRNEFDPEYDNEAEAPLAELEFKESDSSVDRQLKIKMLHIYYSRLEERSRRKAFILERGLLDPRRVDGTIRPESTTGSRGRCRGALGAGAELDTGAEAARQSGRSPGEACGSSEVAPSSSADFECGGARGAGAELDTGSETERHSGRAAEHEGLVQSLTQAQRLRDRVAVLQELRAAGCKSLAEGRRFIQAHYKDNPTAAAAAIACLPPSATAAPIACLPPSATGGVCTLRHGCTHSNQHSTISKRSLLPITSCSIFPAPMPRLFFNPLPLFPHPLWSFGTCATAISTASSGGASAALDISSHPGCDLLSAKERELCTHMRLLPAHYLRAKQVILLQAAVSGRAVILQQAALSGGTISRAAVHQLFRLPSATTDGMFLAFSPYIPRSPLPHLNRLLLGANWIAEAGGSGTGGGGMGGAMGGAMGGGMVKQEGM
ncbi:unnamed protein product [Closterium sp. Naga37s-1]|nr:unnamed protein product [Closterium sp. Naga37s-1]